MKRFLALALAGTMLIAMPVMAAPSPTTAVVASTVEEQAKAENKSVGEYENNAVVEIEGLEDVLPAGQGGHVIINGAPSNVTFFLNKADAKTVESAKAQATALNGKVLNVFTTKAVVNKFNTAQVNFYLKGVKAGQIIEVYQLINGTWTKLTVAEIREDHVVIDMTQHGTLMFVEVPAPVAK